jgi:hypothetical protein
MNQAVNELVELGCVERGGCVHLFGGRVVNRGAHRGRGVRVWSTTNTIED